MSWSERAPVALSALEERVHRALDHGRAVHRALATRYPIAQTPHEVVWTLNKARLLRYVPQVPPAERRRTPILLVYALMNRPSILDLRPGVSWVEHLVRRGHDVFLIDWGAPGPEDAEMRIDDYVLDYLPRAVRRMKRLTGSDCFDVVGWCIGAILALSYAALRPDSGLRNLVLLTAPVDHSDRSAPGFRRWVDREVFDPELVLSRFGNMPGEFIEQAAKNLKPVENHIGYWLRVMEAADAPGKVESWHALHTWLTDNIDMTGGFYRQLVTDVYNENRLVTGTLELRGERVDLGQVRVPVLNVLAADDHLVPISQSSGFLDLLGSEDRQQLTVPGGHIGLIAGSGAKRGTWPLIDAWLDARDPESGTGR